MSADFDAKCGITIGLGTNADQSAVLIHFMSKGNDWTYVLTPKAARHIAQQLSETARFIDEEETVKPTEPKQPQNPNSNLINAK